jgi:ATP-dependent DNA helicase PIF1
MTNQATFNCANETCQRVMKNYTPFGGKSVVILGDFRQTCPVVRGGSRAETVQASIKSSPLWPLFHIYCLSIPIRNAADIPFAQFLDSVGDGESSKISLANLRVIHSPDNLINFVYPDNISNQPQHCLSRAILAPTNKQVNDYNAAILSRIAGNQKTYFATDTLKESDDIGLSTPCAVLDYIATKDLPGLPPHYLQIKKNGIYRLLRNLSIDRGLVKNARVVVTDFANRVIKVQLLHKYTTAPFSSDNDILIPRITFSMELPISGYTLRRKQFPLALSYATTFNSCLGLTLDRVGIDVTHPVFSHGQLYTALSRVRQRDHVCIRVCEGESEIVNVTYHELLV